MRNYGVGQPFEPRCSEESKRFQRRYCHARFPTEPLAAKLPRLGPLMARRRSRPRDAHAPGEAVAPRETCERLVLWSHFSAPGIRSVPRSHSPALRCFRKGNEGQASGEA